MSLIFPLPQPTLINTVDGDQYPVSRIYCIGRNYAAHAREMGKDPDREPPFFFSKWASTLCNAAPEDNTEIPYPPATSNYHFEAELALAIGTAGFQISETQALSHIWGYAASLDMTRRDLQSEAKALGRPWDSAKNVDFSCPIGRLVSADQCGHLASGKIQLSVNGETRQLADLSEMIWSVPEIISHISNFYPLNPGDLILTGTPAGVGAVLPGDDIHCDIAGLPALQVRIGNPL